MTLSITPALSWELGTWTAAGIVAGVEIDHKHFEDIRKRLWLGEHLAAGVNIDQDDFDSWPTSFPDGSATWKEIGELYIWWNGNYWTNHTRLTYAQGEVERPPAALHAAHDGTWILSNTYFVLAPDPNRYHHFDNNAYRNYCRSGQRGTVGVDFREWSINTESSRLYPKQTDPKEIERPVYYTDTARDALRIRNKRALSRYHITQPDTLGAIYSAWNYYKNGSTITRVHHVLTDEDAPGNQYAHDEGEPGNTPDQSTEARPKYAGGTTNPTDYQWTWDEKFCDGMQNRIERICCRGNWVWPTWNPYGAQTDQQTEFQTNWLARNDPTDGGSYPIYANGWNPVEYDAQPWFASIRDEMWGCNESGFEFILWLLGEWDWYFDIEHPFMSWQNVKNWILEEDANGEAAADAKFPRPFGTWRRTWKYSFLRRYISGRRFQYMRQGSFEPSGISWPENGDPGTTWPGLFVDELPEFGGMSQSEIDDLDDRHAPEQIEWQSTESFPEYEIKAAMLIEMREVLILLKYYQPQNISMDGAKKNQNLTHDPTPYASNVLAFAGEYAEFWNLYDSDPDNWDAWSTGNYMDVGIYSSCSYFAGLGYYYDLGAPVDIWRNDVAFKVADDGLDPADEKFNIWIVEHADEIYVKVNGKGINVTPTATHTFAELVVGIDGDYTMTLPIDDDATEYIGFVTAWIGDDITADEVWLIPQLPDVEIAPDPPAPPNTTYHEERGTLKVSTNAEIVLKLDWDAFASTVFDLDYTNHIAADLDPGS